MSAINEGGPAFPAGFHPDGNSADQTGMTLRDWFAGQYLAGWTANPTTAGEPSEAAEWCYKLADAMILAREKTNQ